MPRFWSPSDAADLLTWYWQEKRDLPWRNSLDPYRILVSEMMLQQTRVETVLGFYEPFLERFPTVAALASASLDDVLGSWAGLGYYRRARNLHAAAQRIVVLGDFPSSREALRELPGVGEYASAAVASIAFGEVVPVVDGNVNRVVSRLLALGSDPGLSAGRKAVLERASALLCDSHPGDGNQAMMELGATICLPRAPLCDRCPLSGSCEAFLLGTPESFPRLRKAMPQRRVQRLVAVVRDGDRWLLSKVPETSGQLAGLWEFPRTDQARSLGECGDRLTSTYGGEWSLGERLGSIRHTITRTNYQVEIRAARLVHGGWVAEGPEMGWFALGDIDSLAVAASVKKVLAAVSAAGSAAGDD